MHQAYNRGEMCDFFDFYVVDDGVLALMYARPPVKPRTVSLVLEWENILLARASRAQRLLEVLPEEVEVAIAGGVATAPVEVIVPFDADEFGDSTLVSDLEQALAGTGSAIRLRTIAARSGDYYELKNEGAREAQGELLVFLDSDVIPEPGWLVNLLRPFEDGAVGVVAGYTYLEPVGLYGKAFALSWIFPLRATSTTVRPARKFWANNVAFRRSVFERFGFPALDGSSRDSCWLLANRLTESGVQMVQTTGAQVQHPAPNGLRHFLVRGVAQGRDRLLSERALGSRRSGSALGTARRLGRDLGRSTSSILRNSDRVGLGRSGVPAAIGISTSYYLLCTLGEVATMVSPRYMSRHFKI